MRKLNREQMKILAVVSMVTDHICKIFFPGNATANIIRCTFGRFAFVIFLLLFIEGFFQIKKENYGKHLRDLGLCVLASFPGYAYAYAGKWTSGVGIENIMTEFLITFLLLVAMQRCGRTPIGIITALVIFLMISQFVLASGVGYGCAGPLAAFAIWCIGDKRSYVFDCIIVVLAILLATRSPCELFGVIPLFFYDAERKPERKRKRLKNTFIIFFTRYISPHLVQLGCCCKSGTWFRFFVCKKGTDQRNGIMQAKRKRSEKICIKFWKQKRK